jgi:glycylpeptide N-tetradecanoyltransferase
MNVYFYKEAASAKVKTAEDAAKKSYEFWSTQPVPKLDETITTNEAIAEDVPIEKLRKEPYSLPAGFQWDTLNLEDPLVVSRCPFAF